MTPMPGLGERQPQQVVAARDARLRAWRTRMERVVALGSVARTNRYWRGWMVRRRTNWPPQILARDCAVPANPPGLHRGAAVSSSEF